MSTKKKLFPYAAFFFMALLMLGSSIYFLSPEKETNELVIREENEIENSAFSKKFSSFNEVENVTIEKSRKTAYKWVIKEQKSLRRHLFYRRRAYGLIAKDIFKAENFEELNYHLSRLPSTEKQAFTTLTINRSSIKTLDSYKSFISTLVYPIVLPGKLNNGKDLLISSSYSSKRISPVGAGGTRPHFAVDIINIGNIDYITKNGELVRDENHPGFVVSAGDGVVTNLEFNRIYGWNITVEHDVELLPSHKQAGFESLETFYAHLSDTIYVKEGDVLKTGDYLALLGNSGLSTGPHLHYELKLNRKNGNQIYVNPFPGSEW